MAAAATASAARRRDRTRPRPAPQRNPWHEALAAAQQLLDRGDHEKACELLAEISDELVKAATTARAERLYGKLGPTLEDVLHAELRRIALGAGARA